VHAKSWTFCCAHQRLPRSHMNPAAMRLPR
jgi:hypothetical protein